MEVFPASFALLAIWLIVILRSHWGGYTLTIAMLPFGMFAAISFPALGGLSMPATTFLAAMMIGIAVVEYASKLHRQPSAGLHPATLAFGLFAAYGVFSSIVLVRLFQGSFMVFPLARGTTGVRVDPGFPSVQAPVWPSSSNISQSFYILIAFGFFVVLVRWLRTRGAIAGEVAMAWAAGLNIVLGVLDMLKLDAVLVWVRTASYALHSEQTMVGLDRVIGGFAEPAIFGATSAVFFAYFVSAWAQSGRWRDALLGIVNGILVIMTFSTTGIAAMAVVLGLMWLRYILGATGRFSRTTVALAIAGGSAAIAALALVLLMTPFLDTATRVLDQLFLSKLDSLSGRERSAWAASGVEAFFQTRGLGVGAGSLRSNGLVPVLMGNVGLPGLIGFGAFLWFTIGPSPAGITDPDMRRIYGSARLGAVAQLSSMLLSATVPDPTIMLVVCCALATVALETRESAYDMDLASDRHAFPLPDVRTGPI